MDDNQIREFHEKLSERIAVLEERNDKLLENSKRVEGEKRFIETELLRLQKEIKRLKTELDRLKAPPLIIGSIRDILADGRLDYEQATLDRFDFVIGSIHSRFGLDEAEMTKRVLTAMDDPHLAILGHPTGRLLLSREPYPLDLEAVFRTAAERGITIEVNADPHRLDLDWRLVRRARAMGVVIAIGADAHSVAGMANMEFGLGIARKGWLEATDVWNTLSADDFLDAARRRLP